MKASRLLFRKVRVEAPALNQAARFSPPSLVSVKVDELPNSSFEKLGLYHIKKSSSGYWPVYKKIQNTKVSTEIKRIEGNTNLFVKELLQNITHIIPRNNLRVNPMIGQVEMKGDHAEEIKEFLDKKLLV